MGEDRGVDARHVSISQSHKSSHPLAVSLPGQTAGMSACQYLVLGRINLAWMWGGRWRVHSFRDIRVLSLILTAGNYANSQIWNGESLCHVLGLDSEEPCTLADYAYRAGDTIEMACPLASDASRGSKVTQGPAEVHFHLDLAHKEGSALNSPQHEGAGERIVVQSLYPIANEMVRAADSRVRSGRGKRIRLELNLDCTLCVGDHAMSKAKDCVPISAEGFRFYTLRRPRLIISSFQSYCCLIIAFHGGGVPGLLEFQFEWGGGEKEHRFLPWPGGVMISGSAFLRGTFGPGERRFVLPNVSMISRGCLLPIALFFSVL
ncbi:hypothetical protein R1flu_028107 [Riccia fluitans]|uniref:Uncharacterized protein n=1 Tax=Riccia fluitans TaxID=41844 RepID=A0ABD1XKR3_9MARC